MDENGSAAVSMGTAATGKLRAKAKPRDTYLIPQATLDRARRLAKDHPLCVVALLVGISDSAVRRANKRGWRASRGGLPIRSRPSDFAFQADKMTMLQLASHYHAGQAAVRRWVIELGSRCYEPRYCGHASKPVPTRDAILARISELGITAAAKSFGVSPGTFAQWRTAHALPVERKRTTQLRRRPKMVGWADRYFDHRLQS